MAEIIQRDGTWTFDGETLRLVPGRDKNVSLLRKSLGELAVPLGALAGIAFEQGKKSGRLRLRVSAASCDSYLLPGPSVPLSVSAGDGTASFLALSEVAAVEWQPAVGLENGCLRFTVRHAPT